MSNNNSFVCESPLTGKLYRLNFEDGLLVNWEEL